MAWVTKFQFGLANAFAVHERAHQMGNYAVFMRTVVNGAPRIVCVAHHPDALPAWSTHTAIVNGVQRLAALGEALGNLMVFSTYEPTVACKGIAKTHGLHSITFLRNIDGLPRHMPCAPANVNAFAAAALPVVHANNRVWVPAGFVLDGMNYRAVGHGGPLNFLETLADPLAVPGNPAQLQQWRASWAALPGVIAGPRRMAGLAPVQPIGQDAVQPYADLLYMLLIFTIAGRVRWPNPLNAGSRIVGLLAEPDGMIHGWQVNQRQINTTYHAETNLLQGFGAAVPGRATLYSTLEPCHQCAGLAARSGVQRCVFGQNDPNMTNNTALHNASQRFNQAIAENTFGERIRASDRLDHHRRMAGVMEQLRNPGQHPPRQFRVLDILDSAPSHLFYAQAEQRLRAVIAAGRNAFNYAHRNRGVLESVATALARLG